MTKETYYQLTDEQLYHLKDKYNDDQIIPVSLPVVEKTAEPWIDVKTIPQEGHYLVCDMDQWITTAMFDSGGFWKNYEDNSRIYPSHYRALPPPPKSECICFGDGCEGCNYGIATLTSLQGKGEEQTKEADEHCGEKMKFLQGTRNSKGEIKKQFQCLKCKKMRWITYE